MMANEIRKQIEVLTSDFISLGLSDEQKFPALKELGKSLFEISLANGASSKLIYKGRRYSDIYDFVFSSGFYNIRMLDGAIIQMVYRVEDEVLVSHRLSFYPSPYLDEFQNCPEVYEMDEVYADVIDKGVVPFPLRFDYDSSDEVVREIEHPVSHLTLGNYLGCRIPVSSGLYPHEFLSFILRNFYNTAFVKYADSLSVFDSAFDCSLFSKEHLIPHLKV
jgi:hypothetical protein